MTKAKAKIEKSNLPKILSTTELELPCALTREEIEAYAEQLVTALEDLNDAKEGRKAVMTSLKAREDELAATVTRLRVRVRLRREDRKVRCEDRLVEKQVERTRTDTGQVISTRHANESELQGVLFDPEEVEVPTDEK